MGEHETRHPVGQRRLADAGRSADQPGVGDAAAAIGLEQGVLGLRVAEQDGGFARMRRLEVVIVFRVDLAGAHEATSSIASGAVPGSSRSLTTFQIFSATAARSAVASISTQRSGSLNAS